MAVLQSVPSRDAKADLTRSVIHRGQLKEVLQIRVDPEVRVTPVGDSLDAPDDEVPPPWHCVHTWLPHHRCRTAVVHKAIKVLPYGFPCGS